MDTTTKAQKAIIQHLIIESRSVYERERLWKLYNSLPEESHSSESLFKMFRPHLSVLGMLALGFIVAAFMAGHL